MNALEMITEKAEILVDNLVNAELDNASKLASQFTKWWAGNQSVSLNYAGEPYQRGAIYHFVGTQIGRLDFTGLNNMEVYRQIMTRPNLAYFVNTIEMGLDERLQNKFAIEFRSANMFKLQRALGKHLTEEMTATDVRVREGDNGVEVTACIRKGDALEKYKFVTFATLCGGDIQRLHYRYRSSLKWGYRA